MRYRALTAVVLLLASGNLRCEEEAYLLIDALKHPSTANQPTWIALQRIAPRFAFVHVPAGRGIVNLEPGRYRVSHIDFHKSFRSGIGTIRVPGHESRAFEVSAGVIQFAGILELRHSGFGRDHSDEYRLEMNVSSTVVGWACAAEPDVMARLPVRLTGRDKMVKLVRVKCEA